MTVDKVKQYLLWFYTDNRQHIIGHTFGLYKQNVTEREFSLDGRQSEQKVRWV